MRVADGQFYTSLIPPSPRPRLSIPLTSVFYNPGGERDSGQPASHHDLDGVPLAVNVCQREVDFSPRSGGIDNGYLVCRNHSGKGPTRRRQSRRRALLMADTLPASVVMCRRLITFSAAFQ